MDHNILESHETHQLISFSTGAKSGTLTGYKQNFKPLTQKAILQNQGPSEAINSVKRSNIWLNCELNLQPEEKALAAFPPVKRVKNSLELTSPYTAFPNAAESCSPVRFKEYENTSGQPLPYEIINLSKQPLISIKIQDKNIFGLPDTGADFSCISKNDWLSSWPVEIIPFPLKGLELANNVSKSAMILTWENGVSKETFQPFILPNLPFSLWGRDVLKNLSLHIITTNIFCMSNNE